MSIYPDVPENSTYAKAIDFASIFGIIVGDEKGQFNPEEKITREQLYVIICNLFSLPTRPVSDSNHVPNKISSWCLSYYFACLENQLLSDNKSWSKKADQVASIDDLKSILSNAQTEFFSSLKSFNKSSQTWSLMKMNLPYLSRGVCAYYIYLFCKQISTATFKILEDITSSLLEETFNIFQKYKWINYFIDLNNFDTELYNIYNILRTSSAPIRFQSQFNIMLKIKRIRSNFFKNSDEYVCHYTSLNVLEILTKPHATFHLSNVVYLNDPQEGKLGFKLLQKQLSNDQYKTLKSFSSTFTPPKYEVPISTFFIGSFMKKSDNLPMWIQYGAAGSGCCLEFSSKNIKEKLYQVVYCSEYMNKFFTKILDVLKSYIDREIDNHSTVDQRTDPVFKYAHNILTQSCYLYKDSSYEHEEEIRIIVSAPLKTAQAESKTRKHEFLPRIYWETPLVSSNHYKPNLGLSFSSITLGPTVQNPAYIAAALAQRGYDPSIIKKSNINFR